VRNEFEAILVAALVNLFASPTLRGRTSGLVALQEKSTIALSVVASATILLVLLRGCRSSSAVLMLLVSVLLLMLLPNGTPGLPADWDPTALSSSIMCVLEFVLYILTPTTVEAGESWVRHFCSAHESKPMVSTLLFRMLLLLLLLLLLSLSLLSLLPLLPVLLNTLLPAVVVLLLVSVVIDIVMVAVLLSPNSEEPELKLLNPSKPPSSDEPLVSMAWSESIERMVTSLPPSPPSSGAPLLTTCNGTPMSGPIVIIIIIINGSCSSSHSSRRAAAIVW